MLRKCGILAAHASRGSSWQARVYTSLHVLKPFNPRRLLMKLHRNGVRLGMDVISAAGWSAGHGRTRPKTNMNQRNHLTRMLWESDALDDAVWMLPDTKMEKDMET